MFCFFFLIFSEFSWSKSYLFILVYLFFWGRQAARHIRILLVNWFRWEHLTVRETFQTTESIEDSKTHQLIFKQIFVQDISRYISPLNTKFNFIVADIDRNVLTFKGISKTSRIRALLVIAKQMVIIRKTCEAKERK